MNSTQTRIAYRFGDPEPIGHQNWLEHLLEVTYDEYQKIYIPPLSLKGLDTLTRANGTHRRCINFKVNQMAICYQPTEYLPLKDFRRAARDLETFGDYYLEKITNRAGKCIRLQHIPALNMRKQKHGHYKMLQPNNQSIEWKNPQIINGYHYDTGQSIYGIPDWIGGMHDIFLNSEATLFRRRYYQNGSHMGFILYTNDPNLDKATEDKLAQAIQSGKGAGNFRSLYMNIPNGNEKAVQLIPIGDISQRDEFQRVKNISADDIIVAHGVLPQLAGMKPENTAGFGDIEKAAHWYRQSEVRALVQPFLEMNGELPRQSQFKFDFEV